MIRISSNLLCEYKNERMVSLIKSARRLEKTIALMGDLVGINPKAMCGTVRGVPQYIRDFLSFKRQMRNQEFPLGHVFPCLTERFCDSGDAQSVYFQQDLFVAQRVFKNGSDTHVDVGSRIDGFVAHLATFRKVKVFDIRPLDCCNANIEFVQADMMGELPSEFHSCCDSLSSLHAVEHFGLGRYGDPVCWNGHVRGLANLDRLLRVGGKLYFSVPIGPQRVEFNAHRIFSVKWLLDYFAYNYKVDQVSYIDQGVLHPDVVLDEKGICTNFGCKYGCGIFELTKKRNYCSGKYHL